MLSTARTGSRRDRAREQLRQRIIDAARELFVTEGYAQVTVRKIADAVEYTPGAIYSYFEDKDAVFHAVHRQGFEELTRRMAAAMLDVARRSGTPLDQLRRVGEEYLRFARDNPELYDLMFVAQAPMKAADPAEWPEGAQTFNVVRGVVRAAMDGGYIQQGDVESISFLCWSACHGMVTLEFRGRCSVIPPKLRGSIAGTAFEHLLRVMATTPPARRKTARR